jgi:hypothetical protein
MCHVVVDFWHIFLMGIADFWPFVTPGIVDSSCTHLCGRLELYRPNLLVSLFTILLFLVFFSFY